MGLTPYLCPRSRKLCPCALLISGGCGAKLCHCLRFLSFQSSWITWCDKFPCTYRIFRIVQVFLVFFCRDRFPCTYVQKCIFLPSLRTRRSVLIVFFCVKFPICSTRCFEYPQASRGSRRLQSKNLSRQMRPGSSSALTLPTILFSPSCSCILFAIVVVQLVKLKFWRSRVS